MSRIGNAPVTVPAGVEVTVADGTVTVKGPKGTLSRPIPGDIEITQDDGSLRFARPNDERQNRALHGLTRSLVNNMVVGVTDGFKKELEIVGVGYRAEAQGPNGLRLNLGFSHPVQVAAPEGITFEVPQPTQVIVSGIDKEVVGQVAANIRSIRKPEPYKGKGVRYAGERIVRKAGKAGKK
ncbi:MAG: 50S ribosomal protein L6 [Ilumatobacter sp.]|uniref:50S ribosomal protein L6 n=1 Tax=Ilumatobacter sp. TaxID=1967498 RepID=UPI0026345509|nr:50S ribosomal protein L6 [Ilumatobacter sp.]MDJ0771029.1 50S ribosomal protein L6 [Ilumatobacter sp.]